MHKIVAYILIGACVAVLLWASPLIWEMRDGMGPESVRTTGAAAVGAYLFLLALAAVALTPVWIIGVWLLWASRRLPRAEAKSRSMEEGVWPPPPEPPAA